MVTTYIVLALFFPPSLLYSSPTHHLRVTLALKVYKIGSAFCPVLSGMPTQDLCIPGKASLKKGRDITSVTRHFIRDLAVNLIWIM